MEILVGTSLIAAFVAGVAALFAPCCITVLLPSYLASVFKEKYKIFFMTFVFFLGIATVFLPIGLGASFLAQAFSKYHNAIFAAGGIFLVVLGLTMLLGKKFTTPTSVRDGMKSHVSSVYVLGIFSAIATTCCAPVLAGVLALSIASGTVLWGGLYTLAYVVGMTLPLFIIAAFLDKVNLTEKFANVKKMVTMRLGSRKWRVSVSELVSGLIFLLMGGYITYLAKSNKLFSHSSYQLEMNLWNAKFLNVIGGFTSLIPEFAWAAIFIGIVSYVSFVFIRLSKKMNKTIIVVIAVAVIGLGYFLFRTSPDRARQDIQAVSADNHHTSGVVAANAEALNSLVGSQMPEIKLLDKEGRSYSSGDFRGKYTIFFFNEGLMCYPACWNQVASFGSDSRFQTEDVQAISVVVDPAVDWQRAIAKMPQLAKATTMFDSGAAASRQLGILNTASSMHRGSLPGHTYILMDKEGVVRYVLDDPNMGIANELLLKKISELKK